eukprot:jgi/Hompol1/6997/HPOL_005152-RA
MKDYSAPRIQLYDQRNKQITSWSSLSALANKYFTDGGVSLTICILGLDDSSPYKSRSEPSAPPPKRICFVYKDDDQDLVEKYVVLNERAFENDLRNRCSGYMRMNDRTVVSAFCDLVEDEKYCYYPPLSY